MSTDEAMEGNIVRNARRARGWTQTQLADKLAVNQTTVSGWESGRAIATDKIAALAALLDIDPARLSRDEHSLGARIDRLTAETRAMRSVIEALVTELRQAPGVGGRRPSSPVEGR